MKLYVFLYPIKKYFTAGAVGMSLHLFEEKGHNPNRLSEIIHARYRNQGYRVWWLLFSASKEKPEIPDKSRRADQIRIYKQDMCFASGVTFSEHLSQKKYPDPNFILAQLPRQMEQLVLGGFHHWDCVDKLAAAAHERGIPVIIDEDTTEHFFSRTSLIGEIPLIRAISAHAEDIHAHLMRHSPDRAECMLESRRDKPWFSPVPIHGNK